MAEVVGNKHKTLGATFGNESKFVKLTYDFAEDGGATADTVKLATIGTGIIITKCTVHVETACTSGGSATVQIGPTTADADGILAATAVASLTANHVVQTAAAQGLYVAADDTIDVVVATAALTAGKINVYLEYHSV